MVHSLYSVLVSWSFVVLFVRITTAITIVCPKCGIMKSSGKRSCCGADGAWVGKCGAPGNSNFDHSWFEGIRACKDNLTGDTM